MGLLRKQSDAEAVGNAIADLSQGRDPGFEMYDYGATEDDPRLTDLMVNTVVSSRARKNDAPTEPCFPEAGLALNELAEGQYLSSQALSAILKVATKQELSIARLDARILLFVIPTYNLILREDGCPGLRVAKFKRNANVMALLVFGMLQFRKAGLGSAIDTFARVLQDTGVEIPSLAQLMQK